MIKNNHTRLADMYEENNTPLSEDIKLINRALHAILLHRIIGRWYKTGYLSKPFSIYEALLVYPCPYDLDFYMYDIPSEIHARYPYLIVPGYTRYKDKDEIIPFFKSREEEYPFDAILLSNTKQVFVLLRYRWGILLIDINTDIIHSLESYDDCRQYITSGMLIQCATIGYRPV